MKKPIKINKVNIKDNIIKDVALETGKRLISEQTAKKIDDGQPMTYKGTETQSINGKFIRSKPNDTTNDNLKPN
jgi:hypothetical protein